MNASEMVDQVANAVLYEGYLLYPYRRSAVKNQVRWTFGGIHPRSYSEETGGSDAWRMQTQCLFRADPGAILDVEVRFLQLLERTSADDGATWQEATERRTGRTGIDALGLVRGPLTLPISLAAASEPAHESTIQTRAIEATVEISADEVAGGVLRLTVLIANDTPVASGLGREEALMHSLVSANTVLRIVDGGFYSQVDPPTELQAVAASNHNIGAWPVLIGEPGATDTMLSAPIFLEDYPRIATESAGDLFDSTEIDEILSLRILTMTEEEKAEVRAGDQRGRELLERTESLTADDLMQMHGAIRGLDRRGLGR